MHATKGLVFYPVDERLPCVDMPNVSDIPSLRLADFLRPGAHFYLERQYITFAALSGAVQRHRHAYCECFWIEQGHGFEHRDEGIMPVQAGDLVLLRPEDAHGFSGNAGAAIAIWNLAFPQADWRALRRRHGDELPDWFALPAADRRLQLGAARCRLLCGWAGDVIRGQRRRLDLDRFLLQLEHLLAELPQAGGDLPPAWLADAVEAAREPRWFQRGPRALQALTKRSPEHVARCVRRYYGQTPTQLINEARLAWAADRLTGSAEDIVDIALACGWQNLGCFYRSFGRRFGMPPNAWRQRATRIVQ